MLFDLVKHALEIDLNELELSTAVTQSFPTAAGHSSFVIFWQESPLGMLITYI